jgi:methionyl-tRNA synthetase
VANLFVDRSAPWSLQKTDPARAASVLSTCAEWIGYVARWMAPFMPHKAQAIWEMLGQSDAVTARGWPQRPAPGAWRIGLAGAKLGPVAGLFPKLDDKQIAAEIAALEERSKAATGS